MYSFLYHIDIDTLKYCEFCLCQCITYRGRFVLIYVTNIMIEIKMCVKIEISLYINQIRILSSTEQ